MGPTASGKTALACRLADLLPVSLISVDSAQIYRDMNIGTAKPDRATLTRYPHALIDIRDPAQSYSVAEFCQDAKRLIDKALAQQTLPLLVGGTMLYFQALLQGLADLPTGTAQSKAFFEERLRREGLPALYRELQKRDPATAARIQATDRQRILRFLEIIHLSGQTPSFHFARQQRNPLPWQIVPIALIPERQLLHQRINQRFAAMLAKGLIEETATLKARPELQPTLPSMRCVGYRQTWQYLDGAYDRHELYERGCAATRQLAKRQITWLRHYPHAHLFDPDAFSLEALTAALVQLLEQQHAR